MTSLDSAHTIARMGRPTLVVASSNPGKIAEFQSLLGGEVNIVSLIDLGLPSPEETGSTFEANAELKARYVFEHSGIVTLADDSGLEVDALGGLPGVTSARYAGKHQNDGDNRALLLRNLDSLPSTARTARFEAVIAILDTQGNLTLTRGACEGSIAFEERGNGGFGYDSLFELPDGRTMAELSASSKSVLSHRADAMRRALPGLRAALGILPVEESPLEP